MAKLPTLWRTRKQYRRTSEKAREALTEAKSSHESCDLFRRAGASL